MSAEHNTYSLTHPLTYSPHYWLSRTRNKCRLQMRNLTVVTPVGTRLDRAIKNRYRRVKTLNLHVDIIRIGVFATSYPGMGKRIFLADRWQGEKHNLGLLKFAWINLHHVEGSL